MSIRVMTRVWDTAQASGGALLVLLALADNADESGYCWPDPGEVARRARLSERQVHTVLKTLAAAGEIAYVTRRGRSSRSWYVVLSGLPDDLKDERRRGLEDRVNRKKLPNNKDNRKIIPEKTSDLSTENRKFVAPKIGSLSHENRKFVALSRNGLAQSDAPNDDPIRHDPEDHDPPPPLTPPVLDPAPAAPAGGGGGVVPSGIGRAAAPPPAHPETVAFLAEHHVTMAAAYGDIPLDVARAAAKATRNTPNGPGKLVGLLKRYRAGEWEPPPAVAPPPTRPEPPTLADAPPPLSAERRRQIAAEVLRRRTNL